jgi:hypothetical protein
MIWPALIWGLPLRFAKRWRKAMSASNGPRPGTKLAAVNLLLRRPNGATLAEINDATKQDAWSYKTNGTYLAKRYGGTYGTNDNSGAERRFWIK